MSVSVRPLLLAAFFTTLLPVAALSQTAKLASLTGAISLKRGAAPSASLQINDPIRVGDELITGENSEAVIQTGSGGTVRIYPDSHVVFNGGTGDLRDLLHLFLGSIKVHIEKISGRPNPNKLTTPTTVIAVRGTTFSVFVDEADITLVAVDEGLVGVSNINLAGDEVIIGAGQRTFVRRGFRPALAQRFAGNSERADASPGRALGRERAMAVQARSDPPGKALGRPAGVPPSNPPFSAPGLRRRPGPPR
ncbi:MAG: FecR domain-containing protein [Acidobacteriia bacterium]|nr:FecR domain-containing protein [Terriglobia bacterium]